MKYAALLYFVVLGALLYAAPQNQMVSSEIATNHYKTLVTAKQTAISVIVTADAQKTAVTKFTATFTETPGVKVTPTFTPTP